MKTDDEPFSYVTGVVNIRLGVEHEILLINYHYSPRRVVFLNQSGFLFGSKCCVDLRIESETNVMTKVKSDKRA